MKEPHTEMKAGTAVTITGDCIIVYCPMLNSMSISHDTLFYCAMVMEGQCPGQLQYTMPLKAKLQQILNI